MSVGSSKASLLSADWVAQLEKLAMLKDGWNRYSAPLPSTLALSIGRQFMNLMCAEALPPSRVAASAVGGVSITRVVDEKEIYVEIYNDGTMCTLLADESDNDRTLRTTPDMQGFRQLLAAMRAYVDE